MLSSADPKRINSSDQSAA